MERLPKSYSDQERAYITKRLKEEAAACMGQFGIRRTTVDELVKRVKIPKGTFYLFYPSKELLLFEVIQEQHELVNQMLGAVIPYFVPAPFSFGFSFLPSFWMGKAMMERNFLYLLPSIAAACLWVSALWMRSCKACR